MIYKKIDSDIKAMNSFLEFWGKFHSIYTVSASKELISGDDETKFLETKDTIKGKYDELRSVLDFKYMPHGRLTDPVSDILGMQTIRFISEKNIKRIENDWKDSYVFLNNITEQLSNKKRRLKNFNPVGVFFKRMFDRR